MYRSDEYSGVIVSVIPDNIASNTINLSFKTSLNLNGIKPSVFSGSVVPYLVIFVLFTFDVPLSPFTGPSKVSLTFLCSEPLLIISFP